MLHIVKGVFDVSGLAIGANNVCNGPFGIILKERPLAPMLLDPNRTRRMVHTHVQSGYAFCGGGDRSVHLLAKVRFELPQYGLRPFLCCGARRPPFGLCDPLSDAVAPFVELTQMAEIAVPLSQKESFIIGHHHGPLSIKDGLRRAIGGQIFRIPAPS